MKPSSILAAIKTTLQNSADLSDVNDNYIFEGKRSNITNHPSIVFYSGPMIKIRDTFPNEEWKMNVTIIGVLKLFDENEHEEEVADFINDILIALSQDHTLGGEAVNLSILGATPDDGSEWPLRGCVINIEVLYTQNRLTRT